MSLLNLLLATVSLWRITSLVTKEKGPGLIFYHMRVKAGVLHDDNYKPLGYEEKYLWSELFYCHWCFSMAFGIIWGTLWLLLPSIMAAASLPFVISAGAIVMQERVLNGKS